MRTSRSLPILAGLMLATGIAQAQLPVRNEPDSPDRLSPPPKEAMKIHLAPRLDLSLFALDAQIPDAVSYMPALPRDLLDANEVRNLVDTIGFVAGLRWKF